MAEEKPKAEFQTDEGLNPSSKPEQPTTAADLTDELAKLRATLEAKEKEASENYDRYLRQAAELENSRKRAHRERDEGIRFANESLIKDLLPVVDNLERAVAHAKGGGNGKPLLEGVEMVLKGLWDVFARHGVVPISALGQPFDPQKHEAMAQIESETGKPNTVVEEYHKGYLLRDRLLRPALVSVAKTPKSQEKKNKGSEVENEPGDD
jgi:molecular chaperone GrpE